eukprot:COSAG01_NODE_5944_length_3940_cov_25.762822_5_plen_146_part_01
MPASWAGSLRATRAVAAPLQQLRQGDGVVLPQERIVRLPNHARGGREGAGRFVSWGGVWAEVSWAGLLTTAGWLAACVRHSIHGSRRRSIAPSGAAAAASGTGSVVVRRTAGCGRCRPARRPAGDAPCTAGSTRTTSRTGLPPPPP